MVASGWLLRRWADEDDSALLAAVSESAAELRLWMPWMTESPTLAGEREHVTASRRRWDVGEAYEFGIFAADGAVVGTIGLHRRVGPNAWDIGYWVRTSYIRRGIATAAAGALTDTALGVPGTERVEIRCDEANVASAAVPRRLGYRLDRVDERTPEAPAECGRLMIWAKTPRA
jgi:RimJ/RimL family protein N-acetyltransferase